jgi:hypothetical protein
MKLLTMSVDQTEFVSSLPRLVTKSNRVVLDKPPKSPVQMFEVRQYPRWVRLRRRDNGVLIKVREPGSWFGQRTQGSLMKVLAPRFPNLGCSIGLRHGRRLTELITQTIGRSYEEDHYGFFFDLSAHDTPSFCYFQNDDGKIKCRIFVSDSPCQVLPLGILEHLAHLNGFIETCIEKTSLTKVLEQSLRNFLKQTSGKLFKHTPHG